MKKIIIGAIILATCPFVIILGGAAISYFPVKDDVKFFAGIMGSMAIIFNFIIGCLLIVRGHQENNTFKNW